MIANQSYQIEIAGRLATVYIVGALTRHMAPLLRGACDALPPSVEVICVSLDDVAQLDEVGSRLVRDLHHYWRSTRGGPFRISFARGEIMRSMTVGTWRMLPASR